MQNMEYEEKMGQSFLINPWIEKGFIERYSFRMIKENRIEHLIPFCVQERNGIQKLYYDITSYETIKEHFLYHDMNYEECKTIILSVQTMLWRLSEYLLDGDCLCLDENLLYWDEKNSQVFFIYLAEPQKSLQESFRGLAEYLLEKVDHQDHRAVQLAYHFYKSVRKEHFSLITVIEQINSLEDMSEPVEEFANEEKTFLLESSPFSERNPLPIRTDEEDTVKLSEGRQMEQYLKAGVSGVAALILCCLYLLCPLQKQLESVCLFAGVLMAVIAVYFFFSKPKAHSI